MLGALLLKAGRYEDALGLCRVWLDPHWDRYPRVRIHWRKQTFIDERLSSKIVEYQRNSSGAPCELFNAALAAFRLKGDCELARQCLRLGTEKCPLIMMRILARAKQPGVYSQSLISYPYCRLKLVLLSHALSTNSRPEPTRGCT